MTKPIQDIIEGLEHTKSETEEHIRPLHASKIQDAIDALKAMQWCFDMDKAPRKGRFLAYGKGGEHITTWALCSPKKDMISPHSKPFAWMYLPKPPQDRKEG